MGKPVGAAPEGDKEGEIKGEAEEGRTTMGEGDKVDIAIWGVEVGVADCSGRGPLEVEGMTGEGILDTEVEGVKVGGTQFGIAA